MAMYYYASKISALACGTRCKQTVLQKSRGQRDRDKYNRHHCGHQRHRRRQQQHHHHHHQHSTDDDDDEDDGGGCGGNDDACNACNCDCIDDDCDANVGGADGGCAADGGIFALDAHNCMSTLPDGIRFRRRHSEQLDAYDMDLRFQQIELSSEAKSSKAMGFGIGSVNTNLATDGDIVQYDIPKNSFMRSQCDVNFESSVLGSGGIMYINGRIVSGPLDSLIEVLVPKNIIDLDKEFIFSFLLSSRLFLRPHELLGKLLAAVPDSECLESLVALLAEWTQKFPYDYRDERMMSHVKHIVARCSNSHLEVIVSEILSALLKRLTDLERHEADLRACQTNNDKLDSIKTLDCPTATQYAQILCRLEKKLAKHVGPEEFLQCNSNVLMDKQKKWDQPSTLGGPPGIQDPKKTCNLETYLDWSARLRLFVCNEILQCSGIRDRSKTVELWSGVAQYCLLVGNYNSATAILESLESPPIARLKITWSKLQVTCQQLDCMQRHAEGHGDLWQKQAIVLNENHHQQQQQKLQQQQQQQQQHLKTDMATVLLSTTSLNASATASSPTPSTSTMTTTATINTTSTATPGTEPPAPPSTLPPTLTANMGATMIVGVDVVCASTTTSGLHATENMTTATAMLPITMTTTATEVATLATANKKLTKSVIATTTTAPITSKSSSSTSSVKPNDWVVIPVFADIVKLALTARECCLQRLPNGHININAFDRVAAIVGAFTRHMQAVKSGNEAATTASNVSSTITAATTTTSGSGEYELFCRHMQKTSKLSETELMMASFDCEEPNNAEKLMYDLN